MFARLITVLVKFFTELFDDVSDPVKHCPVYLDKENGSCCHVDGPGCPYPNHCSIIANYKYEPIHTLKE